MRPTKPLDRPSLPGLALLMNRDTPSVNEAIEARPRDAQFADSLTGPDHRFLRHGPTVADVPIVPLVPLRYNSSSCSNCSRGRTMARGLHIPIKEETRWGTGSPTAQIRAYVFARDGYACRYCGASGPDVVLEADHVTPNRAYGPDVCWNLVTACKPCNRSKGGHALDCWWAGKNCRKGWFGRLLCGTEEVELWP